MFRKFHEKRKNEEGFTLIELLVVILIIAILAAIAIPVFLRQREKGWRSQTQSALKNAATAMESWGTEANGSYVAMAGAVCNQQACNPAAGANNGANFPDQGFQGSDGVTVTVTWANQTAYCLQGVHASLPTTEIWSYASNVGAPRRAACPAAPA